MTNMTNISNMTNKLTDDENKLFFLLDRCRNPKYYSYSLNSILVEMKINKTKLVSIGKNIRSKFGNDYKVNIFEWNDITGNIYEFVGFEYRRLDYEKDKLLGINVVEKNIEKGVYSKSKWIIS